MSTKAEKTARNKIIKAALALAAEQGWNETGMADIAEKAGLSLAELQDHFQTRFEILTAYSRFIDHKVMENMGAPADSLPPRDRLFDIIMERFDVLNEDREGVCAILKSFCHDPKQGVISLPWLGYSMSWMLEASGIDTGGYKGALKILGLTGIYLKTLRTWQSDDSPDMAKTMAALDKNLDRAERAATRLGLKQAA